MYNIYCDNINTLGYERKQNAYIVLLKHLFEYLGIETPTNILTIPLSHIARHWTWLEEQWVNFHSKQNKKKIT